MKTIIVDGFKFTISKGRQYHYNSTLRRSLHQYIWEKENGSIPDGHEIHHKDRNKMNNDLSNLELMSVEDHRKFHAENDWDEARREWARENLIKNARPKASEWHKSEDGREWHKEHYENVKEKLHEKVVHKCTHCGESFESIKRSGNNFCSNKCKSAWRRKAGLDDVIRHCLDCGTGFKVNKYSLKKYCNRKCSNSYKRKLKDSPNLQE